jgi:lysophospholipase L1-like esterase
MKSIFVIGDSISCYYGRHLQPMLAGRFDYDRKGGTHKLEQLDDGTDGVNGGDSSMVLTYLTAQCEQWAENGPDYLLVNCGLHDIKRQLKGEFQVPREQYEANLRAIIELAEEHAGQMIWVRSTPVIPAPSDQIADDRPTIRSNDDVIAYNRIADSIMTEKSIPMIDLYTFTCNLGADLYFDHGVHFTEETAAKQAAFITGSLTAIDRQKEKVQC